MIIPEFHAFNKIPRLSRDIIITEKIDGTNGVIYINENGLILAGSRNRWLWAEEQEEVHSDNHGFAQWVKINKEDLKKLGQGFHYGEWMGNKIKRGYGLKEKRFYLFNVSRWCLYNEEPKLISIDPKTKEEKYQQRLPSCCYLVPILYEGVFDMKKIEETLNDLSIFGSIAIPGFKPAEGVVVYHTAGRYLFKKTLLNDEGKNEKI